MKPLICEISKTFLKTDKSMKTLLILIFIFTIGCSAKKEKSIKWNDPGFTVVRAIFTNGLSLGK